MPLTQLPSNKFNPAIAATQPAPKYPQSAWTSKTALENSAHLRTLLEIMGDKPVHTIGARDWELFDSTLRRLPNFRSNKYPGKSISELLSMNVPDTLSSRSIEKYYATISTFDKWLEEHYKGKYTSVRRTEVVADFRTRV